MRTLTASEIVDFARDGEFDLIMMGTHGHMGFKHFLSASIAAWHAECNAGLMDNNVHNLLTVGALRRQAEAARRIRRENVGSVQL